uniref:Ubiquitin specific peptidase 18 n=1 Tax=Sinocyclocheilus grahami TaxID=75366 RepID=A0A672K8L3_SINGR
KNTLEAMRDKSYHAPHKDFLNCLYRQAIRRFTQQDADELFHIILNLSQKQIPDAALEVKLVSLPPILCVHLKRFRNDDGFTKKLYDKVTFPETFSTAIFAAGQSENADCLKADEHYSLYAVVVHMGSTMSGHYTAFISSNQDWYYADDSCVQPVRNSDKTAYLLLYRKKSWNSSG